MNEGTQNMSVRGEDRMLIDGELVAAASGQTFANINPATEEVIGEIADGGVADMDRAIGAARRSFDESSWATDPDLRKRSLRQLQSALSESREVCGRRSWRRSARRSC